MVRWTFSLFLYRLRTTNLHSPIPLLWGVQIDFRVKCSIIALLGLGIFASTAAIVRLTVTVNLSSTEDFLFHAMPVAAWAHAELGLGVFLANFSALRPLLDRLFKIGTTWGSGGKRSDDPNSGDKYVELEDGKKLTMPKGNETRIYGGDLAETRVSVDDDDGSTADIVSPDQKEAAGINVNHAVRVSRTEAHPV
jgi:hypothetical protein